MKHAGNSAGDVRASMANILKTPQQLKRDICHHHCH